MNPPVAIPTATRPITLPDENYGLDPVKNWRLIAKFNAMPPAQRDSILTPTTK
ncbi:hypothetical protein [Arthrobacter sp. efr-133-TYG-118]|uniref:hypothetical protein n=1 Tax=Arthrobacter sp. efr-133-TYG-118 TaxID=3040279 RepID=UPI00254A9A86|nr:hypothetical protein [Arthrobacter sp. efr-133-TYG-118]